MVVGYPKLRRFMGEHDIKISDLVEVTGLHRSHLHKYIHGKEGAAKGGFRRDDMLSIKEAYDMSDEEFLLVFFNINREEE